MDGWNLIVPSCFEQGHQVNFAVDFRFFRLLVSRQSKFPRHPAALP